MLTQQYRMVGAINTLQNHLSGRSLITSTTRRYPIESSSQQRWDVIYGYADDIKFKHGLHKRLYRDVIWVETALFDQITNKMIAAQTINRINGLEIMKSQLQSSGSLPYR